MDPTQAQALAPALKEILEQLATQNNQKIEQLINVLKPAQPDADQIKKDQIQKLTQNFHKVRKSKFKVSQDMKLFLKVFDEDLTTAKTQVGLKDDLGRADWVPIFRASLDFPVVERVKVLLKGLNKTWDNIEINDLKKLMIEEFGSKQTDVAQVLAMFGQHRLVKKSDESVSEFHFRWDNNLPEIMKPTGQDVKPYQDFVDLIHRSLFYIALNDEELQKALSDMKDDKPTVDKYLKEATLAETKRDTFRNIAKSAVNPSDGSGISIAKFEYGQYGQWPKSEKSDKSGKSSGQGAKSKSKSITSPTTSDKSQNNKSKKQPQKQEPKDNSDQSNMKWCELHKKNKSHNTKNCFELNKRKKAQSIKHVEVDEESSENDNSPQGAGAMGFYTNFNTISACSLISGPLIQ